MRRLILFTGLAITLSGCGRYVPPRFADRPPVLELDDDRPIAVPSPTDWLEAEYFTDIYLRRPVVDALDLTRFPYAADANSMDEVPESSFYDPGKHALGAAPVLPLSVEHASGSGDGLELAVTDAVGLRFVLGRDPAALPGTRTAAAVVASRLARALGYRTAPMWALDVADEDLAIGPIDDPHAAASIEKSIRVFMRHRRRMRVSATAWPIGLDLGPTAMSGTRDDDPNDVIEHRDRRSLRALQVLLAWLDLGEIGPDQARDVYVGAAGRGHVDHVLVWLDTGLGFHRLLQSVPVETAAGVVRGSAVKNLLTLGLARGASSGGAPQVRTLAVLPSTVDPTARPARPWEPFDRLQAPDGYWAAKRLDEVPPAEIREAVDSGHIDDPAVRAHVIAALEARRRALSAYWMRQVTPCEVAAVEGRRLIVEDRAVEAGVADPARSRYTVGVLADDGTPLGKLIARPAGNARFLVEVPEGLLVRRGYLVLRVTALRDGKPLPRAFEVHVVPRGRGVGIIGVRH